MKPLFILFALLVTVSCKQATDKEAKEQEPTVVEQEAPKADAVAYGAAKPFTLNDLDGNTISLGDYAGKTVVLHIATTWCPFCNAEAPYLEQLHQDYKDRGVVVLLIDVKEPEELVRAQMKERHGLTFPILLDPDGAMASSYAPEGVLPDLARDEVMLASNLIIDKQGQIQFMSLLDSKNFDAELVALKARLDEVL